MPPAKRAPKKAATNKSTQKKDRKAPKTAPKPQTQQITAQEIVVDNVQSFELVRCVITAAVYSLLHPSSVFICSLIIYLLD